MNYRSRWLLYGPLIAGAVFLIVWFLIWRAGADAMQDGFLRFAADQRAAGASVTHGPLRADGYPFLLRGEVEGFEIALGDDAFKTEQLYLDALPYALDRVILSPRGAQFFVIDGKTWAIAAKGARASIEKDNKRDWLAKAETGVIVAQAGQERLMVERGLVNVAPAEDDPSGVDVSLRLFGLRHEMIGRILDIARIDAAATLTSDGRRCALLVRGIEIAVGGSLLRADGTLSLDDAGRLAGKLDAELSKPAEFARAAGAAGLLSPAEASAAEAGFAMLAVAGGGKIRAPLEFSQGEMKLAGVRIARAPGVGRDQP
jgi:hypothetical protein